MIATAVLIMLVGRLTNLAELNINPILDDRRIASFVGEIRRGATGQHGKNVSHS